MILLSWRCSSHREGEKLKSGRFPELTSERDERMKLVFNSCISEVDRRGMQGRRQFCAARPLEGGGMQLAVHKSSKH